MVKGGDELARGRVPELGGFIRARRENPSAVWAECSVVDLILMGKGSEQLARGRIPELGAVIRARRQDPSTVRTKCSVLNATLMVKDKAMSLPEAASQSLAVWSLLAVRILVPSGLKAPCEISS